MIYLLQIVQETLIFQYLYNLSSFKTVLKNHQKNLFLQIMVELNINTVITVPQLRWIYEVNMKDGRNRIF